MVALVTGGGRGIGQGIALELSKAGMSVAVTARSAEQLAETVARAPGTMIAFAADVADPAAVRALVQEVETRLGNVDLLVNNAGTSGPLGPLWENDPADWWCCVEVNLRGPFLCSREILPGMISRKRGRIVNVVSGAGLLAFPDLSAYVTSKSALIRLSEQMALDAAPHGVSVFALRPGLVRTAMAEVARQRLPYIQKMLDDGMAITPQVVANRVLYLASGKADALSGRTFSVDDDMEEIVRRSEDVRSRELYLLRMRKL